NLDELQEKIAWMIVKFVQGGKYEMNAIAYRMGLSATQAHIIETLAGPLKTGVSGEEIRRWVRVSKQAMSRCLIALERKKLVSREANEDDGRKRVVKLTKEGRAAAVELSQWDQFIKRATSLPAEEMEQAVEGLLKMTLLMRNEWMIGNLKMCMTCKYYQALAQFTGPGYNGKDYCDSYKKQFKRSSIRLYCPKYEEADSNHQFEMLIRLGKG
ncbi:MarR family winged helix-turn-helix transcriptional regulator, partial [Calditrichota bacterium]